MDRQGNTALTIASYLGHLETVRELLRNNADVNLADQNGDTALIWAACRGHLEIIQELLRNKADVKLANKKHLNNDTYIKEEKHSQKTKLENTKEVASLISTALKSFKLKCQLNVINKLKKYCGITNIVLDNYSQTLF